MSAERVLEERAIHLVFPEGTGPLLAVIPGYSIANRAQDVWLSYAWSRELPGHWGIGRIEVETVNRSKRLWTALDIRAGRAPDWVAELVAEHMPIGDGSQLREAAEDAVRAWEDTKADLGVTATSVPMKVLNLATRLLGLRQALGMAQEPAVRPVERLDGAGGTTEIPPTADGEPGGVERVREAIARARGHYAPSGPVTLCGEQDGTERRVDSWPEPEGEPVQPQAQRRRAAQAHLAEQELKRAALAVDTTRWPGFFQRSVARRLRQVKGSTLGVSSSGLLAEEVGRIVVDQLLELAETLAEPAELRTAIELAVDNAGLIDPVYAEQRWDPERGARR